MFPAQLMPPSSLKQLPSLSENLKIYLPYSSLKEQVPRTGLQK